MSRRYPELILDDMLDSLQTIESYTNPVEGVNWRNSRLHRDAIIRNLEILGEASQQLPEEVRLLAPQVPWSKVISFWNRLIHEYHGVNWDVVLAVVEKELPFLKEEIHALQLMIQQNPDETKPL